ncbi:hypothetical protein Brsp07_03632 [Brucella sp. NBRC 14130]|uniref:hypothetical protein n=1 Tax=Brucella sp. NBRC 14130 TaxID=3075483 RepID=UPI0030A5A408
MDKVKKIEGQFYFAKRKALDANEAWNITFKEWLSYAVECKAIDLLTKPNSGMKIVRLIETKPWQLDNLILFPKRPGKVSKNAVEVRDGTEYTTLTLPQWLSALEADKANQHK